MASFGIIVINAPAIKNAGRRQSNTCAARYDARLPNPVCNNVANVSIMNNIAEGWASQSNPELMRFLKYSRRSCAECQNCLYVALDQEYIIQDEFNIGYDMASRVTQVIDGLLRYLRSYGSKQRSMRVKDVLSKYFSALESDEKE